jgi:PhnB protein
MATAQLSPYLAFNGNCKDAMEYYQSVMGGELSFTTFGEGSPSVADDKKSRIMHADLKNDTLSFMASDTMETEGYIVGNNINLSISGTDETLLRKIFDGLSQNGTIDMPLEKAPWGDVFGMCTDKHGIQWLVNVTQS